MPDRTQQHEQNRTAEASNSAQQQAGREAGMRETRDQSRELVQLRDKVAVLQENVTNRHTQERQELEDQHQAKRQELIDDQAERPEATDSRAVDRTAELNTLDRFQDAQREQLAQRQQFEQQVYQELAQAIDELAARQQQEQKNLEQRANGAGPQVDRTFDKERQQLEDSQQQERAFMEVTCQKELQALQGNREKLQVQMEQDQRALQRALFEERPSAEHQQALREVLANQEAVQRKLLAERQLLEQQRFQERVQAIVNLHEGQQKDVDRLQQRADVTGPTADRVLDQQRQRLETRHQQEREQMEAYFRAQHEQTAQQPQLEQSVGEEQAQVRQEKENEESQQRTHEARLSVDRASENERQQSEVLQQQTHAHTAQQQQFEQRVRQEQDQAVAKLQARQQKELEELERQIKQAGLGPDRTLDNQRQQLESRHQQEQAQLDVCIQVQLEQIALLQQLQQRVSEEQNKAIADLQAQHQAEVKELQRYATEASPGADQTSENVRRQMEARQQQERQQLEQLRQNQDRVLKDLNDKLQNQMTQDLEKLHQALDDKRPAAEREQVLVTLAESQNEAQAKQIQTAQEALAKLQQQSDLFRKYSELSRKIEPYKDLVKETNEFNRVVKALYPEEVGPHGRVKNADLRLDAHHIIEEETYKYFADNFKRLGFDSPQDMPAMAIGYEAHIRSPRTLLDSTKEWKSLTKELKEQINPANYENLEGLINAYKRYYSETMWGGNLTKFFENLLDCCKESRKWEPAAWIDADELKAQAAVDEVKRNRKKKVLRNQEV